MNTSGIRGHKHQISKLNLMLGKNMVPQTTLFTGIEGIGKRLIALRLLGSLFCKEDKGPCLKCGPCLQIMNGTHPDLIILERNEKGVIPIGDTSARESGSVRWLIDRLSRRSISGRYGVLIDGIDRISKEGEIALLKTIEEPPLGCHIIMLASNKSEILPTILSRSTEVRFNPLSSRDIKTILISLDIKDSDIELISILSGGSVELAMRLADKEFFENVKAICFEISGYINNEREFLDLSIISKKIKPDMLLTILINIYRLVLMRNIENEETNPFFSGISIDKREKLKVLIKIFLALKESLVFNLNLKSDLKGMIYSIHRFNEMVRVSKLMESI